MQHWRQGRSPAALTWAGRAGDTEQAEAFAAPLVQAIEQQLCSSTPPDHFQPGQACLAALLPSFRHQHM